MSTVPAASNRWLTVGTQVLYALFVAGFASALTRPAACFVGKPVAEAVIFSPAGTMVFVLQALFVGALLRRGRFVLPAGWCSQVLVWPLLLTGLAGAAMRCMCPLLESAWPTVDPFWVFMQKSLWQFRGEVAMYAGLVGVLLFHVCARRTPGSRAPSID